MLIPNRAIWGYVLSALGIAIDVGHALANHEGPITLRTVAVAALVVFGVRKAHRSPQPKKDRDELLEPTEIEIEDGGAELGKASGEAAAAASRAVSRGRGISAERSSAAPAAPPRADK